MNKVTELKKLKNNTYLLTITVKNKTKTHVVSEETIIAFNLLSSSELSDSEYKKMVGQNDDFLLYEKAVHFIDYQMRSISEVKKHLKKSTKDDKQIQTIIKKLKDQHYLDDALFVKEFVTQKIEFDFVGPKYIKQKLIEKGIHYDLIASNLLAFTDDIQFDKINTLILKETKFPIKKPYHKAYVSLKTKLVGKGFSLRIIESAMISNKELIQESCMEEELLELELSKIIGNYNLDDYKEKDKLLKKMLQKGFDYELIKNHLS